MSFSRVHPLSVVPRAPRRHVAVRFWFLACVTLAAACGGSPPAVEEPSSPGGRDVAGGPGAAAERESPPPSAAARDIAFPPIARANLDNGLELDTVEWHQLPIVYLRLVIKSGSASDPATQRGLAQLVTSMLKEGTRTQSSAQLAEAVEFLGASLDVSNDEETITISMRALSQHLDAALAILADVAMSPAFSDAELRKLKKRELDRLALQMNEPGFLAQREFYKGLYGDHPYAFIETTPAVVGRVTRGDLSRFHQAHFVANNAFLVVVGDTTSEAVRTSADRVLGRWRRGTAPEPSYAAPPERAQRAAIVVDRPDSVQSVIMIGNLAMKRSSPAYVPFRVANQVLGGSAASRLFMDLRERRSLTYGAYSRLTESVEVGPFVASASVRTEVTGEALSAFFEHLDRIIQEAPPEDELANAKRYLSDSFPLRIETPGNVAWLVSDLRVFGLPDDYWDSFRSAIGGVTPDQALEAAREHVHPAASLVVVVGKATAVVDALRRYGPVTVLDKEGTVRERFDAAAPQ